jgi:hypothetical protein
MLRNIGRTLRLGRHNVAEIAQTRSAGANLAKISVAQ